MIPVDTSEIMENGMGWCPNTRMIRAAPAVFSVPPAIPIPAGPGANTGRPGRIGKGMELLAGSVRTLVRERQFLWFSGLIGLVAGFMFLGFYAVHTLALYPYNMISEPAGIVLTAAIELISLFLIEFLFAGLILCRFRGAEKEERSIHAGMKTARNHARALLGLSCILALAGTALFFLILPYAMVPLYTGIGMFPFDYILVPEAHGIGPIAGGFHILYAATGTFLLMAINLALFIPTALVVPSLVIERKTLAGALGGAAILTRKIWREMLVCFLALGAVIIAFSALSGLFLVVYQKVMLDGQFWYEFYYKGGWGIAAVVYMAAWIALVLIAVTVAGIVTRDIYDYASTGGRVPGQSLDATA